MKVYNSFDELFNAQVSCFGFLNVVNGLSKDWRSKYFVFDTVEVPNPDGCVKEWRCNVLIKDKYERVWDKFVDSGLIDECFEFEPLTDLPYFEIKILPKEDEKIGTVTNPLYPVEVRCFVDGKFKTIDKRWVSGCNPRKLDVCYDFAKEVGLIDDFVKVLASYDNLFEEMKNRVESI